MHNETEKNAWFIHDLNDPDKLEFDYNLYVL
jgi:hypothetical protein